MCTKSFRVMGFIVLVLFGWLIQTNAKADISLVQSFTESFTTGEGGYFGFSVSGAGDVNGDGHDDVIVGAWSCNFNGGRVYVFFGGPGVDTTPDVILMGKTVYDNYGMKLGYSVSGAGDVNGDGYDDVIVGAYGLSMAYVYYGGTAMDTIEDVALAGATDWYHFGNSVSGAGDVNGDGWDDVIVGEPDYWASSDYNTAGTGRAYVFFGGSNMNNTADVILTGEAANSFFGTSVSGAGDINKDGYADIIVGAPGNNSNSGRALLYLGAENINDIRKVFLGDGGGSSSYFGCSVSDAGDINGDGYDDVIVGAYGWERAYVFFGKQDIWYGLPTNGFLSGGTPNSYFGYSVAGAGDVNHDGYADVVVGAYGYNSNTGRAYVYFGKSTEPPENYWIPSLSVCLTGETANSYFGYSVSGMGDINDDEYADVIVGAYKSNSSAGESTVYYGGSSMDNTVDMVLPGEPTNNYYGYSVSGAGDVNNDGYADIIVGADPFFGYYGVGHAYVYYGGPSLDNTADVILTAPVTYDGFGLAVSGAGDVNNDGYDDVIVGAHRTNSYMGSVYLYLGGSSMDNLADVTFTGTTQYGILGKSISDAGDVNHDGFDDVIVGASYETYVYLGGTNMDNIPDTIIPVSGSMGRSISTAGDVNGDGFDDVIVGTNNQAFIYIGGPNGIENGVYFQLTGEAPNTGFGRSVSGGGDLNGDGFDDVVVGAWTSNKFSGRAYIFYGGLSMDNVADLILNGDGTLEQFGWFEHGCRFGFSVSNAGDLNKDGFADAIVGEDWHNSESGRVYVFYGGSEMDNVADLVLEGEGPSDNFGFSVSNAGDVNGDGANEFVVGACGYNNRNGKAYLYNCVTTLILSMNVNPEGGGTTVPTVGDHTYTSGQIVDISATPEAGYAFVNWTGDVVDPNALSTQVTMNADQTVAANFELPEGAVSYLTETVDNLNLPEGLENSLISKLKSIDFGTTNPLEVSVNSIASGSNSQTSGKDNATAVVNKLNAFINEVEAQSGKKILKEDADYLILFARRIIAAVQNPLGKKSEQDLVSVKEGMPTRYVLYPNHPNPFNPETKITYEIPEASDVLLSIYTINGVKIKDLDIGQRSSGRYTITWQAGGFPSGVYIIRLQAGRFFQMRKCMLIK